MLAAQQFVKTAPLLVVVDQQTQVTVARFVGVTMRCQQPRIAHRRDRRIEGAPAHVVAQNELREAFEHRDFNRLSFAAALAVKQGGEYGMHGIQSGDAVGHC